MPGPSDGSYIDANAPVSSEVEIRAIGECCKALEPIARDKVALKRVYDYLQARFPPHNPRHTRGRDPNYE